MLIYSEPGDGKTHFVGTAQDHPDTSPVLHLGFENGLMTVRYREDYDAQEVRTMERLIKITDMLDEDQKKTKPYYKTLAIDNVTELQKLDMGWVMKDAKATARNPDNVDLDVPSPREWGKSGERMRRIIRYLRDMPMHTIFTAWRGEEKDKEGNIIRYYPKLPGQLRMESPGYFDVVGYLTLRTVNNGEHVIRRLQVQGTERVVAKDRTALLGGVIDDPSIPAIWEKIQAGNALPKTKK